MNVVKNANYAYTSNRLLKAKQIYNILQYIKEKLVVFIRGVLKMLISLTGKAF